MQSMAPAWLAIGSIVGGQGLLLLTIPLDRGDWVQQSCVARYVERKQLFV